MLFALVYVDDLLLASGSKSLMSRVKHEILQAFDVRDLGPASFFLGMEIERDRVVGTLKISQQKYAAELVEKFGMGESRSREVPLSVGSVLSLSSVGDQELDTSKFPFSELVGSLLYLSVCTRPDIAQSVGALARYMAKPMVSHWVAARGVVRYLAGTVSMGLNFRAGNPAVLQGFCDADYAGDADTRRSTTAYVFVKCCAAVSWSSRLQPTVAASTTEAEYMASSQATKEALWLRKLLQEVDVSGVGVIKIAGDNQGALKLIKHPIASMRSKHIDVLHHFVRERVARQEAAFEYCSTSQNVADFLTKPLPESKFVFCRSGSGVT